VSDECPFCNRDPFHYVDNGLGMEAVAVTCCELGDEFYRGARPEPETVTMSWEDFHGVGCKISSLRAQLAAQIIIQRGWEDEARKATSQLASARKALEDIRKRIYGPANAQMWDIRQIVDAALPLTDDFRT